MRTSPNSSTHTRTRVHTHRHTHTHAHTHTHTHTHAHRQAWTPVLGNARSAKAKFVSKTEFVAAELVLAFATWAPVLGRERSGCQHTTDAPLPNAYASWLFCVSPNCPMREPWSPPGPAYPASYLPHSCRLLPPRQRVEGREKSLAPSRSLGQAALPARRWPL